MTRWLIAGYAYRGILRADTAGAARSIADPDTFLIGDPVRAPSRECTPVARYRSFAQFQADVAGVLIDRAYHWVLYDPEHWPDTPGPEQADPVGSMWRFGQLAHALGYRVIMAPSQDLGLSSPLRQPGEKIAAWYTRVNIAGAAARHSDVVDIQAQALTPDPQAYASFTSTAAGQIAAANPHALTLAGVSTARGTAAQMRAAADLVAGTVDGFWLNVPGPDPDYARAIEFLRLTAA
ncbi:MAG TPA: hypothetical protein VF834_25875 [Streptosporangiaceae bacterium]